MGKPHSLTGVQQDKELGRGQGRVSQKNHIPYGLVASKVQESERDGGN